MHKIDFAIKYIQAGFRVFPVRPNDKKPAIPEWQNRATTDEGNIRYWWSPSQNPDYNIGVVADNPYIILDVDVGHADGVDGFKTLENHDALPDTFYVDTPKGGRHYYFITDSSDNLTIKAGIDVGLDIRAGGKGYVVGAGSSINGKEYRFGTNDNFTMAKAPSWIVDAASKDYQKPSSSLPVQKDINTEEPGAILANIQGALSQLDPDLDYDEWVKVGMAIHSEYPGNNGLVIWDSWSSKGNKYQLGCCDDKWPSFSSNGGITLGTLYHLAGIISKQPELHLTLDNHNDTAIGDNVLLLHDGSILYLANTDEWCTWNGQHWVRQEDGYRQVGAWLNETIDTMFDQASDLFSNEPKVAMGIFKWLTVSKNQNKREAVLKYLIERTAISNTRLDSNPNLLGVSNGVLDLETCGFREVRKQDLITRYLATDYQVGSGCPNWLTFLNTVMEGDREMLDYLQRLVGYWLTTETSEQEIYFVYGEGGNGKSTFLDTIKALFGDYAVKIPSDAIMQSKFGRSNADSANIARTAGARLALTDEINGDECKLDAGIVKALSGDDEITARFLHRNPITFKSTAKMVMYGNDKPYGEITDAGLWRRMRLIHFSYTVPEEMRDRHLLSKLKGELPGILKWALTGLEKWNTEGLRTPEKVLDDSKSYRSELDNVSSFVNAMVEPDCLSFTTSREIRLSYETWCENNCEPPRSQGVFQKAIKKKLTQIKHVEPKSTGQARGFQGVRLRESDFYLGFN